MNITNLLPCYHRLLQDGFVEERTSFPLERIDQHWRLFDAEALEKEAMRGSGNGSVRRVAPPDYPEPSIAVEAAVSKRRLEDDHLEQGLRTRKYMRPTPADAPDNLEPFPEESPSPIAFPPPAVSTLTASTSAQRPRVTSSNAQQTPVQRPEVDLPDFLRQISAENPGRRSDKESLDRSRRAQESLRRFRESEELQARRLAGMQGKDAGYGLNG
jgi:hypothetical protein